MGEPQLLLLRGVAAAVATDLDLSTCHLSTAAWFVREHLPETARLFLAMSDEHAASAHRTSRLYGRHGRPPLLEAFPPPRAVFETAVDGAAAMLSLEEGALEAVDAVAAQASVVDQRLWADLASVLLAQRRFTRAARALCDAARHHHADVARLERWARKSEHRFRAMLRPPPATVRVAADPTTPPTYSVSTGS